MSTAAAARDASRTATTWPMIELGQATLARQMWSSRQLYEVMVDFWANHLNVTNPFDGGWDVRTPVRQRGHPPARAGPVQRHAARLGPHPAMMRYLDNDQSDKQLGQRELRPRAARAAHGRPRREVHRDRRPPERVHHDRAHGRRPEPFRLRPEPALDRRGEGARASAHANTSAAEGLAVGDAYLTYLATHPATAKRIAFKLARRFVCDDPPQTLVDRLAQSYLDNGTAIVPVLRTLFSSVEFWMSTGLKTRRPLENVVATARILGVAPGAKTARRARRASTT